MEACILVRTTTCTQLLELGKNTKWKTRLRIVAWLKIEVRANIQMLENYWDHHDWDVVVAALDEIVQVSRQDPMAVMCHMGEIYRRLIDALRLPHTRIVRIAEQTARELFQHVRCVSRPEFDEIVNILLNGTANMSRAIRVDAAEALDSMVAHMPVQFTIRAILAKAPNHRNPLVRATVARLLISITKAVGAKALLGKRVYQPIRKSILERSALFLNDPNIEVRGLAKSLFTDLTKEHEFDEVFYTEVDCKVIKATDKSMVMLRY
ncbi:hypothetical protein AAG570_005140 [Ranatra chinensis]|uniref:CLASP N-terminal domain-containing protein n=1 Tax=Ranatra chinensis TaxID=642074 RepID=A0ABD0YEG8_9HEMI